uniref:SHSP domain-containing protein n=1 Tax=Megaselia scalaris TaxID=36166 RepID=T1H632_MEGSC
MSHVPLMYRDWWDEFDLPIRTSRLLDQHFGTGLKRDDLFSSAWTSSPSVLRHGYIRPWKRCNLQKQDSGSTLNVDSEKFEVILDVQQFLPEEINVKIVDKFVVVEGKHDEKQDEHGYFLDNSQDGTIYQAPTQTMLHLHSHLMVCLSAPMKAIPPPNVNRVIPITQTGPSQKDDHEKKAET